MHCLSSKKGIYIDHPLHISLLLCKDFLRSRKQGKFKTDFMFILEAENWHIISISNDKDI